MATDDPMLASVAGRYASALFDLASEQNKLAETDAALTAFDKLLADSPDLVRLVRSPVFSADDQSKALKAVLDKAGIGGLAGNFLKLVARNRRLFVVPDMVNSFRTLVAKARGEASAEVASAHPLTEAQVAELKATLRGKFGKDVRLDAKVDPSLLGGLVVKVGNRMIDSSLRTKLNSLKTQMKEVR